MISEGSCDTEDWSNDAENSALPSQINILKYIQIENLFKIVIILQIYYILNGINAALMSIRTTALNCTAPKLSPAVYVGLTFPEEVWSDECVLSKACCSHTCAFSSLSHCSS